MKKLIVWTDFEEVMEDLSYAERGRLFTAMLKYAADDTKQPDVISGNERFLWKSQKQNIDAQWASYRKQCGSAENARTYCSNNNRSQSDFSYEKTETSLSSVQDQDHIQDHIQSMEIKKGKKEKEAPTLDEMIDEFASYRKKLKKPMTDRAVSMLRNRLEKLAPGNDEMKIQLLETSIYKGWLDVYPPDDEKQTEVKTTNPFYRMLIEEEGAV